MTSAPRSLPLRRYPALGFVVSAAVLASLLPSALRVPLSGPGASAELAPVPGRGEGQGDLAAFGESAGRGLGSGPGTGPGDSPDGGPDTADTTPPSGSGAHPLDKPCVGNPPRQTEDPLSPPCNSYFRGDNGGATAKGVTADEIIAVDYDSCSSSGSVTDYSDESVTKPAAVYIRHFNRRFQTYGRKVRMYGVSPPCGVDMHDFVAEVDERLSPFFFHYNGDGQEAVAREAARLGMVTVHSGGKRELMARYPGRILSYPPDLDETVRSTVEFICTRLAGRPARFAGDPTMHTTKRKFGMFYNDKTDPAADGAQWLKDQVRQRCGAAAGEIDVTTGSNDIETTLARFRTTGVTTVIFRDTNLLVMTEAEAAKWYPEWFIPDGPTSSAIATNANARAYGVPTQLRNTFGITHRRRLGAPQEQYHRAAFREGCSSCTAPSNYNGFLEMYDDLLMMFTGIQAAGPRLTVANLDKGLHAIHPRRSSDPFAPAAYFGPGDWSFVKDFTVMWWDPTGRPPGGSSPGCWRLVEDGQRYRSQDFPLRPGDDGIKGSDQPCQGDAT